MIYVMVCPKCKSPDIRTDNSNKLTGAMGLPSMYICNACGYSSHVFPEVKMEEFKKFQKQAEKKGLKDKSNAKSELVDTSYGKGIVRGYWKVLGPLALVFGLIFLLANPIYGVVLLVLGGALMYFGFRK